MGASFDQGAEYKQWRALVAATGLVGAWMVDVASEFFSCSMYSGTPHLRPPPKSEWGGLKRGVVSREGFATFNTRGRLQRLTSTLGGAYNH